MAAPTLPNTIAPPAAFSSAVQAKNPGSSSPSAKPIKAPVTIPSNPPVKALRPTAPTRLILIVWIVDEEIIVSCLWMITVIVF